MKESKLIGLPVFSSVSATESITVDELKEHLYIEAGNTDFDAILTTLRKEVRQWIEETCCISLVSKTVTVIIDYESSFAIPYGPVTSFTSASRKTGISEYELEILNEDYEVEAGRFISYTGAWRYKLIYVAGYTSSTIPEGLKLAFKNEVARRFDKRGDASIPDTNELLQPFKNLDWLV